MADKGDNQKVGKDKDKWESVKQGKGEQAGDKGDKGAQGKDKDPSSRKDSDVSKDQFLSKDADKKTDLYSGKQDREGKQDYEAEFPKMDSDEIRQDKDTDINKQTKDKNVGKQDKSGKQDKDADYRNQDRDVRDRDRDNRGEIHNFWDREYKKGVDEQKRGNEDQRRGSDQQRRGGDDQRRGSDYDHDLEKATYHMRLMMMSAPVMDPYRNLMHPMGIHPLGIHPAAMSYPQQQQLGYSRGQDYRMPEFRGVDQDRDVNRFRERDDRDRFETGRRFDRDDRNMNRIPRPEEEMFRNRGFDRDVNRDFDVERRDIRDRDFDRIGRDEREFRDRDVEKNRRIGVDREFREPDIERDLRRGIDRHRERDLDIDREGDRFRQGDRFEDRDRRWEGRMQSDIYQPTSFPMHGLHPSQLHPMQGRIQYVPSLIPHDQFGVGLPGSFGREHPGPMGHQDPSIHSFQAPGMMSQGLHPMMNPYHMVMPCQQYGQKLPGQGCQAGQCPCPQGGLDRGGCAWKAPDRMDMDRRDRFMDRDQDRDRLRDQDIYRDRDQDRGRGREQDFNRDQDRNRGRDQDFIRDRDLQESIRVNKAGEPKNLRGEQPDASKKQGFSGNEQRINKNEFKSSDNAYRV